MKYYLHDSNAFNDEKISELYINFGYEGLGLFYTLLEKFAQQEKPIKTIVLKSQLNVGKKLNKCWEFMETLGLISSNNGETFNETLMKFSEKYKIKNQKNKERITQWRENQQLTKNVTHYESVRNTDKVKKSKVKEIEVIKIINTNNFSEDFLKDWNTWIDYKKTNFKFTYKTIETEQIAFNSLYKLSNQNQNTAREIIHQSIANGYKGLFELKQNQNAKPTNQQLMHDYANRWANGMPELDENYQLIKR
jgi:hypothetical protein